MSDEDPDLSDEVADMIHKAVGEEAIFIDSYCVVAAYSTVDDPEPKLFTWWPQTPKWKLLGMAEGLSEIMRIELRQQYIEGD